MPARPGRMTWMLNLALASLFVSFLYSLKDVKESPGLPDALLELPSTNSTGLGGSPASEARAAENKAFKFEYQVLLPKVEVIPPNVADYAPREDARKFAYRLQTGSFREMSQAERQKASIAFQGLKAHVREVTSTDGSLWYRVEVGPITSRSRMNKAVDRLVDIDIQPLIRRESL